MSESYHVGFDPSGPGCDRVGHAIMHRGPDGARIIASFTHEPGIPCGLCDLHDHHPPPLPPKREPATHEALFGGLTCAQSHAASGWCQGYRCLLCDTRWPCGPTPTGPCLGMEPDRDERIAGLVGEAKRERDWANCADPWGIVKPKNYAPPRRESEEFGAGIL